MFKRQTRKEHLQEVANGISSKLLSGDYTPIEILFINDNLKLNAVGYILKELEKNKAKQSEIRREENEIKESLTGLEN